MCRPDFSRCALSNLQHAIAQAFLDSHIQTHLVRLCSRLHGPETTSLHAPSPSLIRPAPGMTSAGAQLFVVFGKRCTLCLILHLSIWYIRT